jgi:hypothetical protein
MDALFGQAGFLIVAVALISVPIIIHLINRMRFKRIRWAAMEFLLKAQKRTRRRLIIEQLLLLLLRCAMIALVGLLVTHFIGCGDTAGGGKPSLHLVLLDDSPSMQDQWKEEGQWRNCFDVAKNDIIIKKITKGLSGSKTTDRLIVLPLSKTADPSFDAKAMTYERLTESQNLKKANDDIAELQPTMIHTNLMQGVKKAQTIIGEYTDSQVTLHVVSDYRHKDWGHPAGEGLLKELLDLAKAKKGEIKIRAIDTVYPKRGGQGGFPPSRDNIGIVEFRPNTRIVGKNMPVQFTILIQNFSGAQTEVELEVRDEEQGKVLFDVNFNPQNPIKLSPSSLTAVTFERRFNPEIKPGEPHFAHLTVRLTNAQRGQLENDGLWADNVRHAVVEVRDKVPILVIDGSRPRDPLTKRAEEDRDSFFIGQSLVSVPGASYQVVMGEEIGGGNALKALERPDLNKFPTIFLLNVPSLNEKQTVALENYVRAGGGVAFFLGDQVLSKDYNRLLYKDGNGVFPAPLKSAFFPKVDDPPLPPKGGDTFQMIVRDEKFPDPRLVPIFGAIFEEPKQREPLRNLPMHRYWPIARNQWKPEPGRVVELATLPNDASATDFGKELMDIIQDGEAIKAIVKKPEFAKYRIALDRHFGDMKNAARPGSEARAYQLANLIERVLTDQGFEPKKDQFPDLREFWANADENVQTIKRQLTSLREDVQYGDPYIVLQNFGKGKVVAVLSSAGKDWNDWAGGSAASVLYAPFIWELQNYLSSQGSEANLTVGTNIDVRLDAAQFKGAQLKMVRDYMKIEGNNAAKKVPHGEPQFGREDGTNIVFTMARNFEPGVYISKLIDDNAPGKAPIAVYGHAFNIDTVREGDLSRVGSDELEKEFAKVEGNVIQFIGAGADEGKLVPKVNDFSESPWLFLIILLVLVAEQALAVHLSFHVKQDDSQLTPAGSGPAKV